MGRALGHDDAEQARRQMPVTELGLEALTERISAEVGRVAEQGQWPDYISPDSILRRIPLPTGEKATGFDAGIACCLDIIPRDRQGLASKLHAAYTPQAVAQVLAEVKDLDADSESCWWLAGCSVCIEGRVSEEMFLAQVKEMVRLAGDPTARLEAARECYEEMISTFEIHPELGIPYGNVDGVMQGGYLAGYNLAAMCVPGDEEEADLFFLGTFEPTLGLEQFPWSDALDKKGHARSGPVHGSRQFVLCDNFAELKRAVKIAKAQLAGAR